MITYSIYQIELPFIILPCGPNNEYEDSIYIINCRSDNFLIDIRVETNLTKTIKELKAESLYLKLTDNFRKKIICEDEETNSNKKEVCVYTLDSFLNFSNNGILNGRLKRMIEDVNELYPSYTQFVATLQVRFGIHPDISKRYDELTEHYIWNVEVLDLSPLEGDKKDYPKIKGLGPKFSNFESVVKFWGG